MKKTIILAAALLSLVACAKQEKTGLREVLIERFKDDSDLKDYKLDPAEVADCVVDEISASLPGFSGDPRRAQFFEAYEHFLNVKSQADADRSLKEFEQLFGSAQNARVAATSITDHVMTCMGKAIEGAGTDGHRVTAPLEGSVAGPSDKAEPSPQAPK
jgi:hypothetical protein